MIRLRYLLIAILALYIAIAQPFLTTAFGTTKETEYGQAQYLTNKGNEQLNLGQADQALETFKEATIIYRRLKYDDGITGSLINQNLALQVLGFYPRACKILIESMNLVTEDWICDPQQSAGNWTILDKLNIKSVNLLGLQNLGDVLRKLGKLPESKIVLQKTLLFAKQTPEFDNNSILLSLGNTEQIIYQQIRNKYYETEEPAFQEKLSDFIIQQASASLSIYQQINDAKETNISQKLQAQLNSLAILIDFDKWIKVISQPGNQKLLSIQPNIQQQTQALTKLILQESELFSQLPINESISFQINLASSLDQIPDEQLHTAAIRFSESAFELAKSIGNRRMQSYALGVLGNLKYDKEIYFTKALGIAQSINDLELSYKWQKELGSFYKKQGENKKALELYRASIKNLAKIRDNLLTSNTDLQFSFRETVEPIYRDYIKLLVKEEHPNLKQIKQVNNDFQLAQLEDFLKCGKLDLFSLNESKIPPNSVSIDVIDLDDLVLIIVDSYSHSLNYYITKSSLLKEHITNLLFFLQNDKYISIKEKSILIESQSIYDSLITPIRQYLPPSGTLVFTLDTFFQSIPMALLHDGKDYLIKHYSIAETVGSKIRPLKSLSDNKLRALIAGLSKTSPSFTAVNVPENLQPLPEVEEEVANINKQTNSSVKLLNENFTSQKFQKELTNANYPIVHITTHGQFSSDPERTILLAWDKPIKIQEFNGWLKTQQNQDPIELLVLSACQTAKGNKRSALGIAGIAAQAGARSIVASLWLVDSASTTQLMKEFYQGLKNKLTKAESLRQAQLSLLNNSEYAHPYYWAAFLLVGSWL